MKRNLFICFLAVMLTASLVFVLAPAGNAEETTIIAEAGKEYTIPDDSKVFDLNGQTNVTVDIAEGVELSVIDSANMALDGKSAGRLTVKGEGTVKHITKDDNYRYLKVKNDDGSYSFHPFNLMFTQMGINTVTNAICLRVSFIANSVVRDNYLGDYGLYNITGESEDHSAVAKYPFGNKNGVHAYFDLEDSLVGDNVDQTCSYKAYMIIDGERVESAYTAEITPREVLKQLNRKLDIDPTDKQMERINALIADNSRVANILTRFTKKDCVHIGGTATCTVKAACIDCDEEYGELADHTYSDVRDIKCEDCTAIRKVLYADGFNVNMDPKAAGWNSNKDVTIDNGTLSITHKATSGSKLILHKFEDASKVTVEFDFALNYVGEEDQAHAIIQLRNGTTAVLKLVVQRHRIKVNDDDWVEFGEKWATGTTHKMKLVADADSDTCDVYVDDILIKEAAGLTNNPDIINQLVVGAQCDYTKDTGITVSYDNVSVYCDSQNVLHSDDFSVGSKPKEDAGWNSNSNNNATIDNGALNITHTAATSNVRIFHSFDAATTVVAEFDITLNYEGDDKTSHAIVRLRTNGTDILALVVRKHQMKFGSSCVDYNAAWESGTTHKMLIVANAETDTFSVYVDGILLMENEELSIQVDVIDQVLLGAQGNNSGTTGITVSYDNLLISGQ